METKEKPKPKQSLFVVQAGVGYRTERATNFLDIRMGVTITREKVEQLIAEGVTVTVSKNK